jgi:hypothetical protein
MARKTAQSTGAAGNGRQWQSTAEDGGNDDQGRIIIWVAGLGVESH